MILSLVLRKKMTQLKKKTVSGLHTFLSAHETVSSLSHIGLLCGEGLLADTRHQELDKAQPPAPGRPLSAVRPLLAEATPSSLVQPYLDPGSWWCPQLLQTA